MAIRKPVSMPYNSAIRTCCQALRAAGEHPSDLYLVQLIQLRRCLEEINGTFQYDVVDGRRPSLEVVDISLNAFERTIREIGQSAPSNGHAFSSKHIMSSILALISLMLRTCRSSSTCGSPCNSLSSRGRTSHSATHHANACRFESRAQRSGVGGKIHHPVAAVSSRSQKLSRRLSNDVHPTG